jgi:ABC-type multidrug transport system fused ATPase/permease subunit
VLIDGQDVSRYRLRSLRERIAFVQQDVVVLAGSIRDNLRYGRLDADDTAIEDAARAAHAHEFISRLERGYDTELSEAGSGLSTGERQRLSTARAFLKRAPILILDEPTAALDVVSEELVMEALHELRRARTLFVIAHRLSTVRSADRILVMERGHVIAQGTHETLLETSALYRRLAAQLTRPRERIGNGQDKRGSVGGEAGSEKAVDFWLNIMRIRDRGTTLSSKDSLTQRIHASTMEE